MSITNHRDTTRTQFFTYDALNRITTADTNGLYSNSPTNCWGESYTYDQWANLTAIGVVSSSYNGCTQESLSVTALSNNQLSATGFSYDASGNILTDGHNTYGWNAESEIKSAGGVNYTYDGDGDRVEKSNGKIYWYGAGTEILDESDLSGNITDEYIFFGGKRIARRDSSGNVVYYAADHLGTSRVVANATGGILDQSDFYPYGGERVLSASSGNTYKFEGKERDTETNNDDFGARYYSSQFGRWLSPDWSAIPAPVPYANLTNPQTLNLYAMVSDNPETFADLDGHLLYPPVEPGSGGCTPLMDCVANDQPQAAQDNSASSQNPPASASAAAPAVLGGLASGASEGVAASAGPAILAFLPVAAMATALALPPMEQGDPMTPGYMPAPPVTGAPPSTSQQGTVDTSPIQTSRGNNVTPDPNAQGPHSVAKRDPATGKVTGYTTYDANGKATSRYRATGKPHGGVNPPLVLEPNRGKEAGSPLNRARPARPEEIPQ
jgi:RHS repeat-associated protein